MHIEIDNVEVLADVIKESVLYKLNGMSKENAIEFIETIICDMEGLLEEWEEL